MEISADEWYDIQNHVYVTYYTDPSLTIEQMHLTTTFYLACWWNIRDG